MSTSIAHIRKGITPYRRRRSTLSAYQNVNDIISGLMKYHKVDATDYDKFSENFWKGNVKDTSQALFNWCKQNVKYKIEPDQKQTVRSPAAIMAMRHGDCKHYSSFTNGVIQSLKRKGYPIDSAYRFANYKMFKREPHHVFTVARDTKTGQEYWIDPVLAYFDQRKPYINAIDKNPDATMLQRVSGIYDMSAISGRKEKKAKRQKRAARKAKRKAKGGGFFKKVAQGVKKVGGAPSRNAFLLLLKMNLFKLASNIYKKVGKDPGRRKKLDDKWRSLGGNPKQLWKDIMRGVKVYNKHHKSKQLAGIGYIENAYGWDSSVKAIHVDGVGVVPVAAGGAIAAAAAVIAALKPLLNSFGVSTDNIKKGADPGDAAGAGDGESVEDIGPVRRQPGRGLENTTAGEDYEDYSGGEEDMLTDDFGLQDEGELEDYTGEIGFLFKKKKKQQKAAKPAKAARSAKPGPAGPRKVKIKTVVRQPLQLPNIFPGKRPAPAPGPAGPMPGRGPIPVQIRKQGPPTMRTGVDRQGMADWFAELKQFGIDHKFEIGLTVAGLIAAPIIAKAINGPKKRRR